MPAPPTTVPVLASVKETPTRGLEAPFDWLVQVLPPSVVLKISACNSVKIKSNCCSIIYIGKRDTPEILDCSAYLRDPVVPSISCSKDCANLTHSSAVVCIGKGNSQKRVDGSACLVDPRVSRVCCSKDRSIVTHGRSRVCITKGNVLQRLRRHCT